MPVKTIGILGAGSMGRGIAQLAAQSGFEVILSDLTLDIVERALEDVKKQLSRLVEKGKMTQADQEAILARIKKASGLESLAPADFVIEAVFEDENLKKEIFQKLDSLCPPEVILTSNTSSISITALAAATGRPAQVAGMHFFNPAPVMRLVEVIRGYLTSDATVAAVMEVARKMNKTPIEVKKDSPGFVVNRIMLAQFIEAIKLLEEGVASIEDIDTAVKLGLNYPMGPFELMDFTGVDIGYHTLNYLCEEFKEGRWNPPVSLKLLIKAGRLGKKTGAGWYDYEKN
ncbi:MAG: 3-hydroxyacyl-CoA dehydrogenase family protein [Clostridia bacterium]|nr:3-hydroxyacyl-CoA dehydrogenase family protein [Clostridia bacterium]